MGDLLAMPDPRPGDAIVDGDYVTNALRAVIGVVVGHVGESICLVDWPGIEPPAEEATVSLYPVTIYMRDGTPERGVDEMFGPRT